MNSKKKNVTASESEGVIATPIHESKDKLVCGLIRPISTMSPEYTTTHWDEVLKVIECAVDKAGFKARTVSDSSYAKIIHSSIINNIYDDPIVVCDVSNKNANVMFELGMRLAFDKPVVIIKDDKTDFTFDTSSYKHLLYPYDLQFNNTQKFIDDLANTIKETYYESTKLGYTSFLAHYKKVNINVSDIEAKELGTTEIGVTGALEQILGELSVLRHEVGEVKSTARNRVVANAVLPEVNSNIGRPMNKNQNVLDTYSFDFPIDENFSGTENLIVYINDYTKNKVVIQRILNQVDQRGEPEIFVELRSLNKNGVPMKLWGELEEAVTSKFSSIPF